jgi:hypothetical protein
MQARRFSRRIAWAFFAAPFLLSPTLSAETFEARHARDLAANPADLHFRLATSDARRKFQMGQREFRLPSSFWSDSPEEYKLNGATYDRSGRLPTEESVLDREDATDPYRDYFGSGVFGRMDGGGRTDPILDRSLIRLS